MNLNDCKEFLKGFLIGIIMSAVLFWVPMYAVWKLTGSQ